MTCCLYFSLPSVLCQYFFSISIVHYICLFSMFHSIMLPNFSVDVSFCVDTFSVRVSVLLLSVFLVTLCVVLFQSCIYVNVYHLGDTYCQCLCQCVDAFSVSISVLLFSVLLVTVVSSFSVHISVYRLGDATFSVGISVLMLSVLVSLCWCFQCWYQCVDAFSVSIIVLMLSV